MKKNVNVTDYRKLDSNKSIYTFQERLIIPSLSEFFKEIYYYLYTNSNINKSDKLIQEVFKIIFIKIYTETNSPTTFNDLKKAEDVRNIFELVKKTYNEVFKKDEYILLDDESIIYVTKQLQKFKFSEFERDAITEAFQSFISPNTRGDKGQFFTPKNVIDMCIDIIKPTPKERIIDPACGSGGFLIEALHKVNGLSIENVFGIDKEEDLAKITRAYLAIIGNGQSRIFNDDSLDLSQNVKEYIKDDSFDVVLTNPPFGTKIKVKDKRVLKQYELGHKFKKKVNNVFVKTDQIINQDPQVLFIERNLRLLKNNGRMAIVLPDGVLSNPTMAYVRDYIIKNAKILAVISLPPEAFLPSTHTKTSVLFIQKGVFREDYSIFMAECKFVGHDKNGKTLYKLKETGEYEIDNQGEKIILDETPEIVKNYLLFKEGKLKECRLGFTVKFSQLENDILIPTYYDITIKKKIEELEKTNKFNMTSIRDLERHGIISIKRGYEVGSKYYGKGSIPFVRTTDLSNWEITYNPYKAIPFEIYQKYKKFIDIQENDILLVTDGTFLIGTTAIITKYDTEIVIQSHIRRIRCLKPEVLHPYILLYLLNTEFVQNQIKNKTIVQSTISTIGNRIYDIILPLPKDSDTVENIYTTVKAIIEKKLEIRKTISNLPDITKLR